MVSLLFLTVVLPQVLQNVGVLAAAAPGISLVEDSSLSKRNYCTPLKGRCGSRYTADCCSGLQCDPKRGYTCRRKSGNSCRTNDDCCSSTTCRYGRCTTPPRNTPEKCRSYSAGLNQSCSKTKCCKSGYTCSQERCLANTGKPCKRTSDCAVNGNTCINKVCKAYSYPPLPQPGQCGGTNKACCKFGPACKSSNDICTNKVCTPKPVNPPPCGGSGQACCPTEIRCAGLNDECRGGFCLPRIDPPPCGGTSETCCTASGTPPCKNMDEECGTGNICTPRQSTCGARGQMCCLPGFTCTSDDDRCVSEACVEKCGRLTEKCCPVSIPSLQCVEGTCFEGFCVTLVS